MATKKRPASKRQRKGHLTFGGKVTLLLLSLIFISGIILGVHSFSPKLFPELPAPSQIANKIQNPTKPKEKSTVEISGLEEQYAAHGSKPITLNFQVHHAKQGPLQVMYQDSATQEFQVVYTQELANTAPAETGEIEVSSDDEADVVQDISLTLPSYWKQSSESTWQVVLPESEDHKEFTSAPFTVQNSKVKTCTIQGRTAAIYCMEDHSLLFGKKPDKKRANASTTKLMTALVTMEKASLTDIVTLSKKAVQTDYGCLYAKKGTQFYVNDLLHALLIRSSNDSATALAEHVGQTTQGFADLMNEKAAAIGCKNTHFVTPHGLDAKGHYTTARDLCIIYSGCQEYPELQKILKKKKYRFGSVNKKKYDRLLYSTDYLLGYDENFLGGKTGYTDDAGQCFCGGYRWNNKTYVFCTLGNVSSEGRWNDCKRMIKFIQKNA